MLAVKYDLVVTSPNLIDILSVRVDNLVEFLTDSPKFSTKSGTTSDFMVQKWTDSKLFSSKTWLTMHFWFQLLREIEVIPNHLPSFSTKSKIQGATIIRIKHFNTYVYIVLNDRISLFRLFGARNRTLVFYNMLQTGLFLIQRTH